MMPLCADVVEPQAGPVCRHRDLLHAPEPDAAAPFGLPRFGSSCGEDGRGEAQGVSPSGGPTAIR